MAKSVRLQILEALANQLKQNQVTVDGVTHAKPVGLQVIRDDLEELKQADLPLLLVRFDDEEGERVGGRRGPVTEREVDVIVEALAEVPRMADPEDPTRYTNAPTEDATDPLLNWIVLAVMHDERLGGLCNSIQERGTVWTSDWLDTAVAGAGIRFTVHYHTRANDLMRRA